jgi:PAS domain S-box-containing protein
MDAILAIDDEHRIVLFNRAAERIFGCLASDVLGSTLDRFIPSRFRSAHRAHIRRFAETGVTGRAMRALGTLWAVRGNGEEFPIEASISQLNINGKKLFTVILRDITERRRAEQAQGRLAAIVQSSDDAIVSMNLDGTIVSWNPGAQRMYGYSEEEAIGQSIMVIVPTDLQEEEGEILRRLNEGQAIEHYETIRVTKGGHKLNVSLTLSAVRDSDGTIVGVSKITRNVTQQKRAEQSVRESEERFRHVANTAPVMIWMSDPDKLCTYFNEPWLEFTGRSLQQELGNGWSEGIHPNDLERCWEIYTKAFDRRKSFEMEYRLRRHDGEHRWILDRGVPRFNTDGSFAGYIGSCVEVTERKLAQEALSSMSRRLIEAQELERAWIARELHDDINQRLALLAVNLDRLRQELPLLAPATSRRLEQIGACLSELSSDIQTLSHRLHSSKLEYLGVVAAASSFCGELSEKHGVQIDFHPEAIPKSLPREIALSLFRVLQEALQNATKHSGSRHFEVFLRGAAHEIELRVSDSGVGFDTEKLPDRHGLGLTSMKERLKLVHGELSIDSRPGRGTVVRATVPLSIANKAAEA